MLEKTIYCPYCGEAIEILVDDSSGDQHYIEDCAVCCRPIEFKLMLDLAGDIHLEPRRDDD